MKILICLNILLLASVASPAQNIKSWKEYPVIVNVDTLNKYRLDTISWKVGIENNEITATKYRGKQTQKLPFEYSPANDLEKFEALDYPYDCIKVSDGYITIYNSKKFWGIYWFSADGRERYKIGVAHVIQIIKRNDELYLLEGFRNYPYGQLKKIVMENGKWIISNYYEFPSRAYAMQTDPQNNIDIVTNSGIFEIDEKGKVFGIVDGAMWTNHLLNPNSIVIKNNFIYVGMRNGVFKCDQDGFEQAWLMP